MSSAVRSKFSASAQLGADFSSSAISSKYFRISDAYDLPVAGLLVLLDDAEAPVRAELQMYDDLPSHIQEGALRRARSLLQSLYTSQTSVPLRVILTRELRDAVDVDLAESPGMVTARRRRSSAPNIVAGLTLFILAAILATAAYTRISQRNVASEAAQAVERMTGVEIPLFDDEDNLSAARGQNSAAPTPTLPPSRHARADLRIGTRVAIAPGLQLTLRSEPGIDAGTVRGYMLEDDTAVIIGGPTELPGNSDTIVWWLVRLDDGAEAWAAANTSEATLLTPVE